MMRNSTLHDRIAGLFATRPTVGGLMELCEANFSLMERLCPGLAATRGAYESRLAGAPPLQLGILEQTRYTTLVQLTHVFPGGAVPHREPEVSLRVYHDARQVEVVDLRQSILPMARLYAHPGLEQKWRANLFVARWLEFCLAEGHCFSATDPTADRCGRRAAAVA